MTTEFQKALGATVGALRKMRGMSQLELGRRMDRVKSSVSRLENGTANPRLDCVEAAAKALGVQMSTLMLFAEGFMEDETDE